MGQKSSHSSKTTQQGVFSIPLWEYSKKGRGWTHKQSGKDHQQSYCDEFRVLTYNIWFANQYQPMRFQGLCDILNKSDAHIIGLQEMTRNILQQLLAQPFIQQRYYTSDVDGSTFSDSYGVILLIDTRLHISHLSLIDFPESMMGRRLILSEIKLNKTETFRIGTVHLESLNNSERRQCQLKICRNAFTRRSSASGILMGDFNFNAHGQENIRQFRALPGWIDVWANLMGINNPGYTFDTETNAMTKANNDMSDRSRIDRIILRSETIIPTEIEMIGNKSIGNEKTLNIFPSDHYGLTAVFEKKKKLKR